MQWEEVKNSKVIPGKNVVTAKLTHFSLYKIMAVIPDDGFIIGEIYSYPNPAKNGKLPVIHIECGLADRIIITIYNIAGEQVHDAEISGSDWNIIDDKYSYEYEWNIKEIARGIHIFSVRAVKSGEKDIIKVNKLAVIK